MTDRPESGSAGTWPLFPNTLVGQFVLPVAIVTAIVLGVLAALFLGTVQDRAEQAQIEELTAEARLVANAVQPLLASGQPEDALRSEIQALVADMAEAVGGHVTIMLPSRVIVSDSLEPGGRQADGAEIEAALDGGIGVSRRVNPFADEPFRYVATAIIAPASGDVVGIARVGESTAPIDEQITRLRWGAIVATLIVAALIAWVALMLVRRINRSLAAIQQNAHAVAVGEREPDSAPGSVPEFGVLGTTLNSLATDTYHLARQLEQERVRLNAVLGSLSDGIVLTDVHSDVLQINESAARMLQTNARDAIGQPFVLVARDHEIAAALREAIANGTVVHRTNIEVGLSRRVIDVIARPVAGTNERLGLVALRDMTDLRRLETVRREFVANVSHELRTPLASIRALVETLETGAVEDAELAADFYSRIVMEVDRLAGLVDELLDLARLESGRVQLRPVTLETNGLIRHGVERLAPQIERAKLDLVIDLPKDLPPVRADRARVEQVLLNLVHNAIKFTPPGGTITVRATPRDGFVQVDVCDSGIGIAPDEVDRLFERFYKADKARRSEGSGLGLAISKHIVQALGGEIWAANQPSGGAVFSFTLPIAVERRHTAAEASVAPG